MPLTFEVVNAICFNHILDQAYPFPSQPFSRDAVLALLAVSTSTVHLWLGDPKHGIRPLFRAPNLQVEDLARQILERDEIMRDRLEEEAEREAHKLPFFKRAGESFAKTWGPKADLHAMRLFLRFLFDPSVEASAFQKITDTVEKMLKASSDLRSVDLRLFVGCRDFMSSNVTAYQRAKTLLAALDYEVRILQAHERRQAAAQTANQAHGLHSNSIAHSASLTARQTRRSGVQEKDLRRRWA